MLDNKAPQAITSFKAVSGREAPMEVVVVIDAVNIDFQHLGFARDQIEKFLRSEGGHLAYPTLLVLDTDQGIKVLGDFSNDGNVLSAALDREEIGLRTIRRSSGFYGADERLQISLGALHQLAASEAPRPGRKLVLWVSPGWPLLSGPNIELDTKQRERIFANIVDFSTQLQRSRVTLYSVDPLGASESLSFASHYLDFVKGVSKLNQVDVGDLALQVIAIQSGGLVLEFNNDVASLLQEALSKTVPYYELSFNSPAADQQNEYHHLEIKLAKPGLIARTRQGFYAQPAARQ